MQQFLIPLTDAEKLRKVDEYLRKHGRHTMYCGWNGSYYDKSLGCTCGLEEALKWAKEE